MKETEVVLEWEYWPKAISGTVDDLIPGKATMKNMTEAIDHTAALKKVHGDNLLYVTATIRLA